MNPIVSIAQIIVLKSKILKEKPSKLLQGVFSSRIWLNGNINANDIINCCMNIICILKQNKYEKLWKQILYHSSNMNVAIKIKTDHD